MDLIKLRDIAANCGLCDLSKSRVKPVFDKGNPGAELMIVGMVPAHEENVSGIPFVGKAGKLLDRILEKTHFTLDTVYITNLVKCFLSAGKKLDQTWIDSCLPYLIIQINVVQPKIIVTLGADASRVLLNIDNKTTLGKVRGKVFKYNNNVEVIPTYHPSFLLRKGGEQSDYFNKVVEDFELAGFALRSKN